MSVGFYRDLVAWQRSMALVEVVYRETSKFPKDERFGLVQQMRRAAVSIPSNIAEGHSRRSKREYLRFVGIAIGSLAELETQLVLAERLQVTNGEGLAEGLQLIDATGRLLRGLERALARECRSATG